MNKISLSFKESKSKNFATVLKIVLKFNGFDKATNTLNINKRDVYLKWGDLSLVFHYTLKWKGTIIKYKNIEITDYNDMKRIFYELQALHTSFINFIAARVRIELREAPTIIEQYEKFGEIYTDKINLDTLTEEEINEFLDRLNKFKNN